MNREIATEFTTQELHEFLEGDLYPDQADPRFKEGLREELWDQLQRQLRRDQDHEH